MRCFFTGLALAIFFPLSCAAQTNLSLETDELHSRLRFHEGLMQIETLPSQVEWKSKCGPGSHGFYCETKNSKAFFDLRTELRRRATNDREPIAQFYFAMVLVEDGDKFNNRRDYDEALSLLKSSCEADIFSSCYNAGVMLSDGKGGLKSASAAIEWFYRAGKGFLKIGDRDKANAALDQIQIADRSSDLGKRLHKMMLSGVPK